MTPTPRKLFAVCATLLVLCLVAHDSRSARAQRPAATAPSNEAAVTLRWRGTQGVERYRLQLARDEKFEDIVFDRAVAGREHRVTGLAPGKYFWRVAPAARETGIYSKAAEVEITKDDLGAKVAERVIVASNNTGWRTATGEVVRPVGARLRAGKGEDLVGVNSDGTTYALDGRTGVALWITRFQPNRGHGAAARPPRVSGFKPMAVSAREGEASLVVVPFDGGIRALRGESGAEAWRATLAAGSATTGVVADLNGDGQNEIVAVAGASSSMYVIDAASGKIVSETKLESEVVGAPALFVVGDVRGVLLATKDGTLTLRGMNGEQLLSTKLDGGITTGPLLVTSNRGTLVTVGSETGLFALEASKLTPLGKITTESDVVRGTLASVDLEGDGLMEIVLVTERGRVAVISTGDGKIKWFAEGAKDAEVASFADVNGDRILDVLVPAGQTFAVGFSGRDGSLIWKVEEDGRPLPIPSAANPTRSLAVASYAEGAAFLVGGEPSRIGLRAVELPASGK